MSLSQPLSLSLIDDMDVNIDLSAPLPKKKRKGKPLNDFQRVNTELNWDLCQISGAAHNLAHLCDKYGFQFDKVLLKQVSGRDVCMSIRDELQKRVSSKRAAIKSAHEKLKQSPPVDTASKP